jgi:hypothetical protein
MSLYENRQRLTRNMTFKKMLELELPDWIKREAATKIQRFVRSRTNKHGGTKTKRSGTKRSGAVTPQKKLLSASIRKAPRAGIL